MHARAHSEGHGGGYAWCGCVLGQGRGACHRGVGPAVALQEAAHRQKCPAVRSLEREQRREVARAEDAVERVVVERAPCALHRRAGDEDAPHSKGAPRERVVRVRSSSPSGAAGNAIEATQDASAHAELLALRRAAAARGNWRLANCTLYSTLEPCVLCMSACYAFRVGRVVYGAPDHLRTGSKAAGIVGDRFGGHSSFSFTKDGAGAYNSDDERDSIANVEQLDDIL